MYQIPPDECLVETKICKHCGVSFPITDKDMEFYSMISPTFGEKKYLIPPPTLCPDCRQQRRLSFRNERKLYKRKCDATGKDIVSIYSPDKPFKVYHQDYWWSDKWDTMSYGREFDFTRSAFDQFSELLQAVPRPSLINTNSENSEYTQTCTDNKNGYMLFESSFDEDCLYGYWLHYAQYCVDCSFCDRSSHCYDCLDCINCHRTSFSVNCQNCKNSIYLRDCIGCSNCFGCKNLYNKQFHFFDVEYPEREYQKKVEEFMKKFPTKQERDTIIFAGFQNSIYRTNQIHQSEKCSGDYIRNGKNCHSCFYVFENAENAKYMCNTGLNAHSIMDGDAVGANASYIYESINTALDSSNNIFSVRCWGTQYSMYQNECDNSTHCFLSVGLDHKSYCILNKQYTKEEYEILVPKIIEHMMKTGEWGEFFPSSLSPFGYNETVAQEYFPMTRDSVIARNEAIQETTEALDSHASLHSIRNDGSKNSLLHGPIFNWSDYEAPFPKVEKIIPAKLLPENIADIPDDILNWAIECEVTKKPFRIIKQELEFYRKHQLPIPNKHPDQRHKERMEQRNPRKLFERFCDCPHCEDNWKKIEKYKEDDFALHPKTEKRAKKMITTYAPERRESIYCEVCYEREVLG